MIGNVTLEHGLVIFVVLIFLVPCGLIIIAADQAAAYYAVPGEPVKDAALANNITILSSKDNQWNIPGATGGKIYVLTDGKGHNLTLSTQSFDNEASRNTAVHLYNSHAVGRGKPVGSMVVVGQQVIYASPANSPILTQIAPVLKGKMIVVPVNSR